MSQLRFTFECWSISKFRVSPWSRWVGVPFTCKSVLGIHELRMLKGKGDWVNIHVQILPRLDKQLFLSRLKNNINKKKFLKMGISKHLLPGQLEVLIKNTAIRATSFMFCIWISVGIIHKTALLTRTSQVTHTKSWQSLEERIFSIFVD